MAKKSLKTAVMHELEKCGISAKKGKSGNLIIDENDIGKLKPIINNMSGKTLACPIGSSFPKTKKRNVIYKSLTHTKGKTSYTVDVPKVGSKKAKKILVFADNQKSAIQKVRKAFKNLPKGLKAKVFI